MCEDRFFFLKHLFCIFALVAWDTGIALAQVPVEGLKSDCEHLVIFPPFVDDAYTSRRIADEWVKLTEHLLPSCFDVVSNRKSFFMFSTFEVDHRTGFRPDALTPQQWRKMVDKHKATMLVSLRYYVNEDGAFISPTFWRFPATQVEYQGYWTKPRRLHQPLHINGFQRSQILHELVKLGPNSVTIGGSTLEPVNRKSLSSDYKVSETKERRPYLLDQLSVLGFASVTHPDYFSRWDGRMQFTGSQTIGAWDREYKFRRSDDTNNTGPVSNYEMKFAFVAPTLDILMTGHTPVGSFFALVGAGLSTYYFHDTYKSSVFGFRPVVKYGFGYRAFMNNFLFGQLAFESINAEYRFVKNEYMHFDEITSVSVALGFFVPGWEWRLYEASNIF